MMFINHLFVIIAIENPVNNQLVFIYLKKFLSIRPVNYLKNIKREVLLFPSVSRELVLKYNGQAFLEFVILERNHQISNQELKKKIFPIMVNSNRCNLGLKYFNLLKYFRDEIDFEGGYFIHNGSEKVIRTTLTIKQNFFFFLKKNSNQYQTEEFLMIKKIKEDKEISILKSLYHSTNVVTIAMKIKQEEVTMFIDVLLVFFQYNTDFLLMRSSINMDMSKKNFYNNSIYKKIVYNFLTSHLVIKDNLKIFYRSECLKLVGICLISVENKRFWIEKETIGFKILKKDFLDKIIRIKKNYYFTIDVLNILITNKIEKKSIDNLNLFNNMETILSGDLCCSVLVSALKETYIQINSNYNGLIDCDNIIFLYDDYCENIKKYISLKKIFRKLKTLVSIGSILMFLKYEPRDFGNSVILQRFNKISFLSDLDLVHRGMYFKKQIDPAPRKIFLESFGFICPINTPDGVLCGLLNHFCIGTKVIPVQCFNIVEFNFIKKEILLSINMLKINPIFISNACQKYTFFVNNNVSTGVVNNSCASKIIHYFYKIRCLKIRQTLNNSLLISYFVSINRKLVYDEIFLYSQNTSSTYMIYSYDQSNRIMRLLKQRDNCSFQLIGCTEQLHIKINWLLYKNMKKKDLFYSHEDVMCGSLLSFTASLFPYTHHNQSTRNIYQCKMSKQAIGYQNNAYIFRRDSKLQFLVSSQLPIINTENMLMYNFDLFPFGSNTLISICSNTGLDMEDACVFKKSSREFGLFHSVINKNRIEVKKLQENIIVIQNPVQILLNLIEKNELFDNNDAGKVLLSNKKNLANMVIENLDNDHSITPNSKIYKKEYNTFDYMYEYNNFFSIGCLSKTGVKISKYTKVIFRKPNIGDKLSSRHGQKNVISILYKSTDFPFDQTRGVIPDLILNPHSFPSRMTIGMLREILLAKSCTLLGKTSIVKSNSARDYGLGCVSENDFYSKLENNQKSGYDKLIDGKNGLMIINQIFSGVVFYQKMQQMVKDKVQFRILGKNNTLTKQPVGGRMHGGAIRIGEMEKDGLIAHGAASVIIDRFLFSSDVVIMGYCLNCEKIVNIEPLNNLEKNDNLFYNFYSIFRFNKVKLEIHDCASKKIIFIEIPYVLLYLLMELFTFSLMPDIIKIIKNI
uniref:DNA-directed RNA polymerase n=1 Tax=Lotharella vacuolata TaxID=74820 RepID=A0A0H5BHK0_9EUKA|nr:second-largest subunit of DNA-directed RNA polymerase I [Lotharella vacuolata]